MMMGDGVSQRPGALQGTADYACQALTTQPRGDQLSLEVSQRAQRNILLPLIDAALVPIAFGMTNQ
jgi:hypothetical protein